MDMAIAWNLGAHVMGQLSHGSLCYWLADCSNQTGTHSSWKTVRLLSFIYHAGSDRCLAADQAGDKICIFGFSRGAYTARSLAGMLHKVGLLPAGNHQQVPFAYKMYNRCDDAGWKQSVAFKKAFSINVDIEFVGVWSVK